MFEWSKENGYLPRGRAYFNRTGFLVIKHVRAYDGGTFICTVSDGFTFSTAKAMLSVEGTKDLFTVVVVFQFRCIYN